MRGLLFLARVAFICNLFFVLCLFIRHTHFTIAEGATGFVVIVGWVMSVIFNLIFTVYFIWIFATKKALTVPLWLVCLNLICFSTQIVYRIVSPE
jgi:hypothetical protein